MSVGKPPVLVMSAMHTFGANWGPKTLTEGAKGRILTKQEVPLCAITLECNSPDVEFSLFMTVMCFQVNNASASW